MLLDDDGFVRAAFYVDPPGKDASDADWLDWQVLDDNAAKAAKTAYTKSLKTGKVEDLPEYLQPSIVTVSIGGRHTQRQITGMTGSDDGGDFAFEVAIPSHETAMLHAERFKRDYDGADRGRGRKLSRNQRKRIAKLTKEGKEIDWSKFEVKA